MVNVPPALRLLLAVVITVGITLALVAALHRRLVAMSARDDEAKKAHKEREEAGDTDLEPLPPEAYNLANRALGLTSTGFVFLLAFTLGNFWGVASDARAATEAEGADLTRAVLMARQIEGGQPIVQALEDYKTSVVEQQWPLMQRADAPAATAAQLQVAQPLTLAMLQAEPQLRQTPEWAELSSAVDDLFQQARDRIDAVPNPAAPGVVALIFVLGITNLAMAAVFQPARLGPNLFLIGLMATITAVMLFVLVEASNPYVGAAAVRPIGM